MSDIDRITQLLHSDAMEKQIAAAIVLGELRAKGTKVTDGLLFLLRSGVAPLQRHALDALAQVGAKKALPDILPLLASGDSEVRAAAARAVASVGTDVIGTVRTRLATATPEEHKVLDSILARVGGKEAFSVLLQSLVGTDEESARAAAVSMRQRIRESDPKEHKGYLAQVQKFIKLKSTQKSPSALTAAIKIIGYLEDKKTLPLLVGYAKGKKLPASVRQEAIIALRFVLEKTSDVGRLVDVLLDAANDKDRALAQTALHTLAGLSPSAKMVSGLRALASNEDFERARFAIEHLGRMRTEAAREALTDVLVRADKKRAEIAALALAPQLGESVTAIAKGLVGAADPERAWFLRQSIRNFARKIPDPVRKQMLKTALDRLKKGQLGWEPLLELARDAEPKSAADALRSLGVELKRARKLDAAKTAFRALCRGEFATDEDRYILTSLELARGRRDTNPVARANDEQLNALEKLSRAGFDVAAALRKDRAIPADILYYVGFHFAEKDHPLGEELLTEVVQKVGRTKLGKMAKNKLALARRTDA